MSSGIDHFLRDAARLYRLVDQVASFVREHQSIRSYPPESRAFLEFVVVAAESTKTFLETRVGGIGASSSGSLPDPRLPARVAFISEIWGKLHNFVKPVADAHTLQIPLALVRLLNRQAQGLGLSDEPVVAIELVSPLNYLQRKHSPLRLLAAALRNRLGTDAEFEFPKGLGIVGLPYSQGPFLFFNCLLYHELGHYYFEQKNLSSELKRRVFQSFKETLAAEIKGGKDPEQLFKIARPWFEEVFCDLFAVRLLGPAYTFVFAELFDLIGDLRNRKATLFSRSHPSASMRLEQQILLLKEPGDEQDKAQDWWTVLSSGDTPLLSDIEKVARELLPSSPYQRDCEGVPVKLVSAFKESLPAISALVREEMNGRRVPVGCYNRLHMEFSRCLEHAIVPSNIEGEEIPAEHWCVALINTAYFMQLGGLEKLFRLSRRQESSVRDHALLRKRIEQWTLKAIEDRLQ